MNKATILCIVVSCAAWCGLSGDITQIQITWKPQQCEVNCQNIIAQQMGRVDGSVQISTNQQQGSASLTWAPSKPGTVPPLGSFVSMIWLGYDEIRLTVRGSISMSGGKFLLISLGDNTSFTLMELPQLSPYLQTQLTEAAQQGKIAVVTGPLYKPENAPPYNLLIQQLSFVVPR